MEMSVLHWIGAQRARFYWGDWKFSTFNYQNMAPHSAYAEGCICAHACIAGTLAIVQ